MRITAKLLARHKACPDQVAEVRRLWPRGVEPTVEALTVADAHGLDVLWLARLLPAEGPSSARAFALWCAEQVSHLCDDARVTKCLRVVRRLVEHPGEVSGAELSAARSAAGSATYAARSAARYAAESAAGSAQIACLAQLLCEAEVPA